MFMDGINCYFSEELTELNIQLETGSETEQDLKSSLSQAEGNVLFSDERKYIWL